MSKQQRIVALEAELAKMEDVARQWQYEYVSKIKHTHGFFRDNNTRCFLCGMTKEEVRKSMPSAALLAAGRKRRQRNFFRLTGRPLTPARQKEIAKLMSEHPLYREVGRACTRHLRALQRYGKDDKRTKRLKTKYANATKRWVEVGKPTELDFPEK